MCDLCLEVALEVLLRALLIVFFECHAQQECGCFEAPSRDTLVLTILMWRSICVLTRPQAPIHPISLCFANFVRLSMISGQLNNNKPHLPMGTGKKADLSRDTLTIGG